MAVDITMRIGMETGDAMADNKPAQDELPLIAELEKKSKEKLDSDGEIITEDERICLREIDQPVAGFYKGTGLNNFTLDASGLSGFLMIEIITFIIFAYADYTRMRNVGPLYIHRFIVVKLQKFLDFARENNIVSIRGIYDAFHCEKGDNLNICHFAMGIYLRETGQSAVPRFEDDIWPIDEMFPNIPEDRRSSGERVSKFDFTPITSQENKNIIKDYMRYLLVGDVINVDGVIVNRFRGMKLLAECLGNKSILDAGRDDMIDYVDYITDRYKGANQQRTLLTGGKFLCEYLKAIGKVSEVFLSYDDMPSRTKTEHKERAVEQNVLDQIFYHLDDLDEENRLIFLILESAGSRINDILRLPRGRLEIIDGHYFINFYYSKVKYAPRQPIPPTLYKMLLEWEDKTAFLESEFLFPNPDNPKGKISRKTHVKIMNDFIAKWDIRKSDGNLYPYRPHDLRHSYGTRIEKHTGSIFAVQRGLGHVSPRMPMLYVDHMEEKAIRDLRKGTAFINSDGVVAALSAVPTLVSDEDVEQWVEEHVKSRFVGDGICNRPCVLGECQYTSGAECIGCESYRTSPEFLPQHYAKLRLLQKLYAEAKKQGVKASEEKFEREIQARLTIIEKLENMKGNNRDSA